MTDPGTDVIALFPLGHVLLPGMPLPLHVFEPRYRQLLADVTARPGSTSFGVVALTRGSEVDTGPGAGGVAQEPEFASVGTLAEVLEVQRYDDGASDLFTVGSRRFRIERIVPGKEYLRAEVEFLAEVDGAITPQLRRAVSMLEAEHARLIARLTGQVGEVEAAMDDTRLSYRLAAQLPFTGADRQDLLEQPDTAARLGRLAKLLRREIALLRRTHSIAVSPGVLELYIRSN